jgi:perosamine synthetase
LNYKIPIYMPQLGGNEKKYVMDCLDSTWISSKGKYIAEFEREFASYTEIKYATTVSNGTVALHLALVALGIGPGDEVIVPTLTYIASVNAIRYTGATPVFVDSLKSSWQLDPDDIKRKITPRTRALMVVHLYGHPCDMDAICTIAKDQDLFIVEDCAEAFGAKYKGRHVGSFGDIATYSFFGNKTITTGEGGMVVTNNSTLQDRVVHFKGQGLAKYRQYWHDVVGYNYRMTNICAAIGLAQLEQAADILAKKKYIAQQYRQLLNNLPVTLQEEAEHVECSYWMCSILVQEAELRDALRDHLERDGIETRPLFYPVHTMPMYADKFQHHRTAEDLGWRGINLPSWPGMTDDDLLFVVNSVKAFYQ